MASKQDKLSSISITEVCADDCLFGTCQLPLASEESVSSQPTLACEKRRREPANWRESLARTVLFSRGQSLTELAYASENPKTALYATGKEFALRLSITVVCYYPKIRKSCYESRCRVLHNVSTVMNDKALHSEDPESLLVK